MFSKKKCPNCGAKNPKYSIACAMCGAAFAVMQVEERLEGRKEPIPAWPKEVEKQAEEEKAEEEAEITCPECGTVFLLRDALDVESLKSILAEARHRVDVKEDVVNGTDEEDEFDFVSRVACSDGNCIGIIINGRCNICGKPYKGERK
jgi:hypothetical protein